MPSSAEELLDMLDLRPLGGMAFEGVDPSGTHPGVFGGQLLAQALTACSRSVTADRVPHSLHAYFLRPGRPQPGEYRVEIVRDGRAFSARRAVALQDGKPILHLSASFHTIESGPDHQDPSPRLPIPNTTGTSGDDLTSRTGEQGIDPREWSAFEARFVDDAQTDSTSLPVWLKATERLPDAPIVHCALLAYSSDFCIHAASAAPHPGLESRTRAAMVSVDHAIWFHRQTRVDEWLLHDQQSPSASNGLAISRSRVFDTDGKLVASAAQEGLLRWTDN